MKVETKTKGGTSVGFIIALLLVFLKFTGHIAMSWFWVITSFIWVPILIIVSIISILFLIGLIAALLK